MDSPARETLVLTHAGAAPGLALARALGRQGYRVVGVESSPGSAGLRSRYLCGAALCPDPEVHAFAFCEELARVVRHARAALVLPGHRAAVQALWQGRTPLERYARIALPEREAWQRLRHGGRFHELAHSLGLPVPALRRVSSLREAVLLARDLGYPVELRTLLSPTPIGAGKFIAQDWIRIPGEQALARAASPLLESGPLLLRHAAPSEQRDLVLLADAGLPVAAYQSRVSDPALPEASLIGAPSDTELFEYATALLHALRWTGLARARFRLEEGQWVLADLEPTGGVALAEAEAAGVPLAHAWVRLCLDGGAHLDAVLAEPPSQSPPARFPWDDPLPELPGLVARVRGTGSPSRLPPH